MKIDGTLIRQAVEESGQAGAGQSPGQAKGAKSAAGGDAFANLLQSEVESAGETGGQDSGVYGPTSVSGLWGAQSIVPGLGQPSPTSETISSISTILDGLDSLQNALQATKSPKQINSLIQQINEQAAGLDNKMTGLPANSRLRDLAEETKVTAYMESMKWKRGEYL
ncbi:MAG: hypothetical protein M1398_06625 [Deltaproteobacteria bacterium]|jgi:hypothetical protein|nr:hypothetical protein [Deltaproteobacteria bacterium]MDA8305278.1 hypothetical protein [Deltaproteobacteria bacterium]